MKELKYIVVAAVILGSLFYVSSIVYAGIRSYRHLHDKEGKPTKAKNPPEINEFVTQAVTGIGAVLATHFGALFGISQFMAGSSRSAAKFRNIPAWVRLPARETGGSGDGKPNRRSQEQEQPLPKIQIVAAYVYFGSLVLAFIFWAVNGFSPNAADIIRNMTSTLLGVVIGIMSVALNVKPAKPQP